MVVYILKIVIQLVVVVGVAPIVNGIIKKIKAWSQHRKGAPVLQLYYDLFKLFKKDVIIPEHSSWIFRATPYICLAGIMTAAFFTPVVPQLSALGFTGDAILVVYLLAGARFFMVLAGLDTGSTFGGMGSSREMMISSLIEPSLIVTLFTIGLTVNSTSLTVMYKGSLTAGLGIVSPVYMLLLASMIIVLIAETARIPVDDPATHLELTMVHEAMLLEYSGRYFAMMQLSASIKQLLVITVIANLFMPLGVVYETGTGIILSLVLYITKVIILAAVAALIEVNSVKLRLFTVPNLAAIAFILSILGFMSSFVFGR